jgi:hypothetical protein
MDRRTRLYDSRYRRIQDEADEEQLRRDMLLEAFSDENLDLLADEVSETFGFDCPPFVFHDDSRYPWIGTEPFDLSNEPIIRAFIKKLTIDSRYGTFADPKNGVVYVTLTFEYNHYDGSNGHDIGTAVYDADNGFWTINTTQDKMRYNTWDDRLR